MDGGGGCVRLCFVLVVQRLVVSPYSLPTPSFSHPPSLSPTPPSLTRSLMFSFTLSLTHSLSLSLSPSLPPSSQLSTSHGRVASLEAEVATLSSHLEEAKVGEGRGRNGEERERVESGREESERGERKERIGRE